jgi:excinuclease ABC subunit C
MHKKEIARKEIPDAPGVYFFRGRPRGGYGKNREEILYIGKATSLRDRVRSYFSKDIGETRGPKIVKMLEEASSVSWERTDSVLEALILEANLIKQHQPLYNTDEKDDTSFNYVVITNESFPRVLTVRGRALFAKREGGSLKQENRHAILQPLTFKPHAIFGPFPSGTALKDALRLVRRIFPFFDTKRPVVEGKNLAFNRQIGLYPKKLDAKEYAKTIRHIIMLFSGKKVALVRSLESEMKRAAKAQEFEKAQEFKRQLFALQHIRDVSLIKTPEMLDVRHPTFRVEGYDVAHLRGSETIGVMTVVEDGEPEKGEYRTFKIRSTASGDDYAAFAELLSRRLAHPEWRFPDLVVIDGGTAHLATAAKALRKAGRESIPLVSVVKDERHRPREILGEKKFASMHEAAILLANSEAHRFALGKHRRSMRRFPRR